MARPLDANKELKISRKKERPNPNSLGTFIETIQSPAQTQQRTAPAAATILARLERSGPEKLSELQVATGFSFTDFAEALKSLEASGLVVISDDPGRESVARATPATP